MTLGYLIDRYDFDHTGLVDSCESLLGDRYFEPFLLLLLLLPSLLLLLLRTSSSYGTYDDHSRARSSLQEEVLV